MKRFVFSVLSVCGDNDRVFSSGSFEANDMLEAFAFILNRLEREISDFVCVDSLLIDEVK